MPSAGSEKGAESNREMLRFGWAAAAPAPFPSVRLGKGSNNNFMLFVTLFLVRGDGFERKRKHFS